MIWNDLSEEEQKWVKEAADESLEFEKKIWHEAEMEALAEIKKAGVEVITPDKEPFRNRVKSMYEQFSEDPDMKELIEAIQAVKTN